MNIYKLFAEILEYPGPRLPQQVSESLALLAEPAADSLRSFQSFVKQIGSARLQELYTSTFDMRPDCALYLGHHILGEDHRRGLFMAKLREEYRKHGFSDRGELPDQLPVVLRFLAVCERDEFVEELVADCLLPVMAKLTQALASERHPYASLLQAISDVLKAARPTAPRPSSSRLRAATAVGEAI